MRSHGLALAVLLGLTATPGLARAHHVPGHASSEGVRSINSIGSRGGRAQTRALLLGEFAHDTTSLAPGQQYGISLLGEYAPVPAFSVGVQAPLQIIDERGADPKVGYGDTRLLFRVTPHARKLTHRVLTLGLNASFPTRTVRSTADPGRVWVVAPNAIYTRTYARLFWQVIGVTSVEHRPAGTALDISAGAQVGLKLAKGKVSPGLGVLTDVRALTWCAEPDGAQPLCAAGESRATETDRPMGATRAAALATFSYNFARWGAVTASAQVPFTPKRDYDVGASLGFQVAF